MARFASGVSQVKQSRCMVLFGGVKIGRSVNAVAKGLGIGSFKTWNAATLLSR